MKKMTAADVIALLKEVGVEEKIINKLKNDVPLLAQGIDSIDLPALAAATEARYEVDLSKIDTIKVKTIDDFVAFVNKTLELKSKTK